MKRLATCAVLAYAVQAGAEDAGGKPKSIGLMASTGTLVVEPLLEDQ